MNYHDDLRPSQLSVQAYRQRSSEKKRPNSVKGRQSVKPQVDILGEIQQLSHQLTKSINSLRQTMQFVQ
ncbi:hypothetical protein pb186bvf_018633 [Paramecium bursaria]